MLSEDHKEIATGKKKDDEGYMARIELDNIENSISKLRKTIKGSSQQLPAWVQSKITRAADYIDTAAEYLASNEKLDEKISFDIKAKDHKTSGRKHRLTEKIEQVPTSSQQKLPNVEKLGPRLPKFESTLTERILAEMGCDCDMKPAQSVDQIAKKHNTSTERIEKQLKRGIKVEMEHTTDKSEAKNIALQHLAERPDYYTRLKKVEESTKSDDEGLHDWFNKSEEFIPEAQGPCWDGYQQKGMKKKGKKMVPNCVPIDEAVRIQSQSGQLMNIMLNWKNKIIMTQLFFPQIRIPKRLEIIAAVEKVYPGAKVLTFRVSNIDPNIPLVQVNEEGPSLSVSRGEKLSVDQGGGLTAKGRAKYNRATGSNLKAPVTGKVKRGSKAWKRRKNFCSRSRSWKGPRGLAARRRWKC